MNNQLEQLAQELETQHNWSAEAVQNYVDICLAIDNEAKWPCPHCLKKRSVRFPLVVLAEEAEFERLYCRECKEHLLLDSLKV